ncbi:MAG TPA: 50S ribosomal protein L15 [Candidatus Doudnabacteria bacterium]|nr:50S ribosomal protein L15 [Candidatus Doudnabacteria bacterium]
MKLHDLKRHPKSTKRRKVVGRGLGSGHGTYSTRGAKGQKSRTGHSKSPAAFEGGRQPLVRQVPKSRGFKSIHENATAIKLDALNAFNDGDEVTISTLKKHRIIANTVGKVKLLKGGIKKKLVVKVPASATAKTAIEAAGGSVK